MANWLFKSEPEAYSWDKMVKDKEVGEDEVGRAEKQLDASTKKHTDAIDDVLKHKEAELLEV